MPDQWGLYYTAYIRLEGERYRFTGHIPWSKVMEYCQAYQLSAEQTEWMIEIIERVDNAVVAKRIEDGKKSGKSRGKA